MCGYKNRVVWNGVQITEFRFYLFFIIPFKVETLCKPNLHYFMTENTSYVMKQLSIIQ